jgi:1-deoxy-D-xylulose-5-phosphate reductoisomerase
MNPLHDQILAPNRPGPVWQPGDPPLPITILGSTGSVGTQTFDVVMRLPERFRVVALSGGANLDLLCEQADACNPELVVANDPSLADCELPAGTRVAFGADGLLEAATHPDVVLVVTATSGHAAIVPTAKAIEAGKTIALANKETIVCAGELIMPLAERHDVAIRPVDSEHSAIWQALGSSRHRDISRLILTASGGPFRATPKAELEKVTSAQAMNHPTWAMGGKITIDSATLMNKGLEVIEAHWLFSVPFSSVDVVVHPESIVHSIVEFNDCSQVAQLGLPDMRLPIQYALTYPDHAPGPCGRLSLTDAGALRFEPPDENRFPALRICREAGMLGGPYTTILSAADEIAVDAFMKNQLRFSEIPLVVERALSRYTGPQTLTFETLADVDAWARVTAAEELQRLRRA